MKQSSLNTVSSKIASHAAGAGRYLAGEILQRPRTLFIEVTMRCNARCDFCSYWQLPKMYEMKEYRSVVKKLKPLTVILTGGEPLVRKDLPKLISEIKREGPLVISLLTNGRLLTDKKAKELLDAGLDTISVSLNHIGAAQDEERHLPGLFDHISSLMPTLARMGFKRVNVNTVFLENNLDEIPEIVRLAKQWGVGVSFSCYSAKKANNRTYEISKEHLSKLEKTLRQVDELQQNGAPIENSKWYLERVLEFYQTGRVRGRCPAGRKTLHITPDGYVKPCPDFPRAEHYTGYCPKSAPQMTCDDCWYACRGEVEAPLTVSRALYFVRLWRRGALQKAPRCSDSKKSGGIKEIVADS